MRILGISGSLRRDSHNRRLLLEAAGLLCGRHRARAFQRLEGGTALRRGRRSRRRGRSGRVGAARRDRTGRRRPVRDAGVQLVRPRPAEERDRLGIAPTRRRRSCSEKPVAVIGASTGFLRRRLGAGRAEERSSARPAPGWSTARSQSPRAHVRLEEDGRLLDEELAGAARRGGRRARAAGAAGSRRGLETRQLCEVAARRARCLLAAGSIERAAQVEQVVREVDVRAGDPHSLDRALAMLPKRAPAPRALLVVPDHAAQRAELFHDGSLGRQPCPAIGAVPDCGCGLPAARRSRSADAIASNARIASLARHHWQIASITATWITIR